MYLIWKHLISNSDVPPLLQTVRILKISKQTKGLSFTVPSYHPKLVIIKGINKISNKPAKSRLWEINGHHTTMHFCLCWWLSALVEGTGTTGALPVAKLFGFSCSSLECLQSCQVATKFSPFQLLLPQGWLVRMWSHLTSICSWKKDGRSLHCV